MTEHNEQAALFQWAEWNRNTYPDLDLLFAIPNGAKLPYTKKLNKRTGKMERVSIQANILKAEGLKSGVPDICLPVSRGDYNGLFIELKFGNNKATENQEWWIKQLTHHGYCATVVYGWEQAAQFILSYLEGRL